jgi:hypothetical protein
MCVACAGRRLTLHAFPTQGVFIGRHMYSEEDEDDDGFDAVGCYKPPVDASDAKASQQEAAQPMAYSVA